MWLLTKEAVLTHENLNKRGYQLAPRCTLCGEHAETISHLFFALYMDRTAMENVHLSKGDKMGETGSIQGVLSSSSRDGNASDPEEMETCPSCIW